MPCACIIYGVQSYHDYLHLYNGRPHTSLYEAKVLEHLVLKTESGNGHLPQTRNDSQSSIVLSLSGLTACTLTYPLDVVRSRLAFQVADEEIYCGVCHAIQQIFTTEGGFCALYKGYGATAVSMIPAVGKSSEYVNIVNSVLRDETLVLLL